MTLNLLEILFLILFIYISLTSLYLFVFSMAGKLGKIKSFPKSIREKKIAILIPAYKEDAVIIGSVENLLEHNYPRECFKIFIAAHSLQDQTIKNLKSYPITVIEIESEYGSKALSLQALLNNIKAGEFEIALILDADNHLKMGALQSINDAFDSGSRAVQLHRIAKNLNTPLAVFDAISEEINNHVFRKGTQVLGFSASTIGSGMAFRFEDLKRIYNLPGIIYNPACDREVDYETMSKGIAINYIEDAYVLDEKVQYASVFTKQRTRWMESQIWHLKKFSREKDKNVIYSRDFLNKFFSNLMPSRVLLFIFFIIVFTCFFIQYYYSINFIYPGILWWTPVFLLFILSLLIAIPYRFFNSKLLHVILLIPRMMFYYVKALSGMRSGKKHFEHTPKGFK